MSIVGKQVCKNVNCSFNKHQQICQGLNKNGYKSYIPGCRPFIIFFLCSTTELRPTFQVSRKMCSMIMYASPCLCVCERRKGLGGGHAGWALVFVRKSCLTICCLPPQHTHIWNWSSTVSCSQQCGQRERKVTAKDLPQSVMGCGGGLMCHATAVALRTLTSTSSLLQNITLITLMPDCLSACRWILLRLP